MAERIRLLEEWLKAQLQEPAVALTPASCDASSRRYWRLQGCGEGLIAMDAPPLTEDNPRFVRIAETFRVAGLNVPEIVAADLGRGFLLIGDLGTRSYLDVLDETNAERLYGDALAALAVIQARVSTDGLPPYDEALLRRELGLFSQWLLEALLGLGADSDTERRLTPVWDLLVANALEQPRVCVHRDFHSRNLMVSIPQPGILDFQDAVSGPVTYDLVSLLRDCYIAWPAERVAAWTRVYLDLAIGSGILRPEHAAPFPRWMDLMGIQRHLKAAGIFARLKLRDGRPGYLADIPRTLGYVLQVAPAYPELAALTDLVGERVLPAFTQSTSELTLFDQLA